MDTGGSEGLHPGARPTIGQPDLISKSGQPAPSSIFADFGRVGSVFGSFCPYDAVYFGFRVAREFRVYDRGHFALTIYTDLPIRLARGSPHRDPTQNVDRILNLIGLAFKTP